MIAMNCPHCGAPCQIPPGVSPFLCGHCRRSFDVNQAGGGFGGGQHNQGASNQVPVIVYQPVRVVSGWSMYWTIRLVAVAIVALISVGGWIYHRMTGNRIAGVTDDDDDDDWSGSAPLVCDGIDDMKLTNVKASFTSGAAITATANCKVVCTNCTIHAPIGVNADGNANVILIGGSLDGDTSIIASGNAKVEARGATVTGPVQQSMNAKVTGVPAAAASAAAKGAAPAAAASTSASASAAAGHGAHPAAGGGKAPPKKK